MKMPQISRGLEKLALIALRSDLLLNFEEARVKDSRGDITKKNDFWEGSYAMKRYRNALKPLVASEFRGTPYFASIRTDNFSGSGDGGFYCFEVDCNVTRGENYAEISFNRYGGWTQFSPEMHIINRLFSKFRGLRPILLKNFQPIVHENFSFYFSNAIIIINAI